MTDNIETFDTLWEYCSSNKRAIPKDWQTFYEMLTNKRRKPSGEWEPPLPFLLSAWYYTMPLEKHLRFREHVLWACDNGQLDQISDYLHSLSEQEWYHFGEL